LHRFPPRLAAIALALILTSGSLAIPTPTAGAPGVKRPNLQMYPLHDLRLTNENGKRLLRFTSIFVNAGPGHFETRGTRDSTSDPTMEMDQVLYRTNGTTHRIATRALSRYSGDGHNHWHVQNVVTFELWRVGDSSNVLRGAKTGFCFFDTTPWRLSLPGARQYSYYRQEWCGTISSLSNRVGVSVGWGDRYPWNFVYQWVDVSGLPGGNYTLRATVDQGNFYRETDEYDNCLWVRIAIPPPGQGNSVTVLGRGDDCGLESIRPVTNFPGGVTYSQPRRLTFEPGTYTGHKYNAVGTTLDSKTFTLGAESGASARRRATPAGQTTKSFLMVDGVWAGYWIRDTDRIDFE
jgi:hypothetical protein